MYVEFEGVRFYRKPSGYLVAAPGKNVRGERYLHRAVWVHHDGPIPDGYDVHHVDHDRGNNAIGNLRCLPRKEHAAYHARLRVDAGDPTLLRGIKAAQEAAKAWHRSAEGREWHAVHGKAVAASLPDEKRTCVHCGGTFTGKRSKAKRGFCSAACQSAARRASGVDNEPRTCAHCGGGFVCNKHSKQQACSAACGAKVSGATRSRVRPNR